MDHRSSDPSELVPESRPARRVAAVGALVVLGALAVLVLLVVVVNFRLVAVLLLAFGVFFAGMWGVLSRHEWWRWICGLVGAIAAVVVFVVVLGIGWVSTGATLTIFVLSGLFTGLTRYALGDRIEFDP